MSAKLRCAIYTRKSTEDGLDQEFNSLDAQREACESYIKSQRHEGWLLVADRFDDGGISGGTMERPGLIRLLEQVRDGKVDVIVVYKVDRLTRSLADFAKIVELLDANKASFVSVTQQFNTTTSMGRLTLNVLLSFAQFEREVTAERIRDKIAASKKKGMWMGGLPPLGYDIRDKRLVINEAEASTVRQIFALYQQLGTVRLLRDEVNRMGIRTKVRHAANGRKTGGLPLTRGHLYQLLSNPIYVGEISHKGTIYPGQHEPVIGRVTWDAVQGQLKANAANRYSNRNAQAPSLLAGLIHDDTGDRMSPSHASKGKVRYRYYISNRLMNETAAASDGWRLPARQLETAVCGAIGQFMTNGVRLIDALCMSGASPDRQQQVIEAAGNWAATVLSESTQRHAGIQRLVRRVSLQPTEIHIDLMARKLHTLLLPQGKQDIDPDETVRVTAPIQLKRRGVEARLILTTSQPPTTRDETLVSLVARAHCWMEDLASGKASTIRDIALRASADESDVSRFLPLAFLAPDIVEAIAAGKQPVDLTTEKLKRIRSLPRAWKDQRRLLGFPA